MSRQERLQLIRESVHKVQAQYASSTDDLPTLEEDMDSFSNVVFGCTQQDLSLCEAMG